MSGGIGQYGSAIIAVRTATTRFGGGMAGVGGSGQGLPPIIPNNGGGSPLAGYSIVDVGSLISQTPVSSINESSRSPREQQATIAAAGTVLPLVYGRTRLGPKIAGLFVRHGNLVITALWCEGPVESIESITMDDLPLPASIGRSHYYGDYGQVHSNVLQGFYQEYGVDYSDSMPTVVYSVFVIPPGVSTGFPRFNAIIKGLKVSSTDGGTPTWSDNPAYCIADFITNARYGMNRLVDWNSVALTAAACNQIMDGGDKKRRLNLALEKAMPGTEWLQVLRDYAGCWCVPEGARYRLVPDEAGVPVADFTASDMVENTLQLQVRGTRNIPTVVEVVFMQTGEEQNILPWREDSITIYAPGVLEGTVPQRRTRISKPGLLTRAEASRYGTERLKEGLYGNRHLTVQLFDIGVKIQVGDIITLTHPKGLNLFKLRVHRVDPMDSGGRWLISGVGYSGVKYDTGTVAEIPPVQVGSINSSVYPYMFQTTQTLTNMTMFYDWFMRRYWVTDMDGLGDTWDTFFPDPMEDYVLPLWQYHTPGDSLLKTETHDWGVNHIGTWTAQQTYFAVSGTVFPEMGISTDNSLFTYFPMSSVVTTQGQYGHLQNYCFTTSTLYVTWLGEMRVTINKGRESGSVHTSATTGQTVVFIGMYTAIISALISPIGNTARSSTVDRILVNSVSSESMQYNSNVSVAAGQEERTFYNSAYVVLAGDFLEYDVYVLPSSGNTDDLGGINVYNAANTDNIQAALCLDENSDSPMDWPSSTEAIGVWAHRKIDLTNFVGETTGDFTVSDRSGVVGPHIALYNNVEITNGVTTSLSIYVGPAQPPLDVQKSSTNATGAVGQANTMQVYLFDDLGVQVEGDATWTIEGVL